MIKINRKGFTLVELLATITILGILSITAVIAYSKYKEKAKKQVYDTLAKSSMNAMEEYLMDNPAETASVTINKLFYEQYLERPADATDYSKECAGLVEATATTVTPTDKKLDIYDYTVTICCNNYEYQYNYKHDSDNEEKIEINDSSICSVIKSTTAEEKAAQAAAEAEAAAEAQTPQPDEPTDGEIEP